MLVRREWRRSVRIRSSSFLRTMIVMFCVCRLFNQESVCLAQRVDCMVVGESMWTSWYTSQCDSIPVTKAGEI